ncbi:MAG: hypothetical protein M3O68_00300 [Thermoproteota archaeon]|nr:hypothetical protein [Thermoproteota archaeon]
MELRTKHSTPESDETGTWSKDIIRADAMENIFYSIEFRIKNEIGKDAKPYRSWWNSITDEWNY